MNQHLRKPAAALVALSVIGLAAACGNDGVDGMSHGGKTSGAASSASTMATNSSHNDADVAFATHMIAHHRQAVQMAAIAPRRGASAQVVTLAAKIKAAQQPEIDTMSGWLVAWGKPVPMEGMDHGDHAGTPGMMTEAQMDDLNGANGTEFDKAFLKMMIEHHKGAVTMAKTEQADGKNPDAKALAGKIIADQTAEIAEMEELLNE